MYYNQYYMPRMLMFLYQRTFHQDKQTSKSKYLNNILFCIMYKLLKINLYIKHNKNDKFYMLKYKYLRITHQDKWKYIILNLNNKKFYNLSMQIKKSMLNTQNYILNKLNYLKNTPLGKMNNNQYQKVYTLLRKNYIKLNTNQNMQYIQNHIICKFK